MGRVPAAVSWRKKHGENEKPAFSPPLALPGEWGKTNMLNWNELEQTCAVCRRCRLWENRHNPVFGVGNRNARLMLVGEGPGEREDALGEPFVGRAGQLLDSMLASIGLDRSEVYIANIVKCRPPNNRDPQPDEQDACIGYLENQIRLVAPEIIVCLGRIAAARMIRADFKITKEHGIWFEYNGIRIIALFHPAALLRDPRKLPDTFEDLRKIEEALLALGSQ